MMVGASPLLGGGQLFVGGVMNLLWAAAIAALVRLEKVVPHGVLAGLFAVVQG